MQDEVKVSNTLKGATAIARYMNRSVSTVYNLQRDMNFPMFSIGGVWEADAKDIEDWKESQRNGVWYEREASEPPKKETNKKKTKS